MRTPSWVQWTLCLVVAVAGCANHSDGGGGAGGGAGAGSGGVGGSGGNGGTGGAGGGNGGTGGAGGGGSDILVPAQGVLLGHFYGNGTLAATDAKIGRKPKVHLTYWAFADDWASDPTLTSDFAEGRIPLVNWEPDSGSGPVDFAKIRNGDFDAMITARAKQVASLGHKLFIDFAAEMNGDEGWGNHDAQLYIDVWRHVHDLFTANGASNVVWVWAPNVTDSPGTPDTMAYYPGDAYVDWTGVDGYNWGTSDPDFDWQSFKEVFADIYPKLAAKQKPIFIGEMASDETGGNKADWIADIVPTLKGDYPLIRAFVWFDIKKERSWQIDSSPAALTAYQALAADPFTNP
jgi:hypothetical protein